VTVEVDMKRAETGLIKNASATIGTGVTILFGIAFVNPDIDAETTEEWKPPVLRPDESLARKKGTTSNTSSPT
jgi:hypothetical protein